jgi:hypothetical protein
LCSKAGDLAIPPPVIPDAEPQTRLSGISGNESNLPRSLFGAPLADGSRRVDRDDGCP